MSPRVQGLRVDSYLWQRLAGHADARGAAHSATNARPPPRVSLPLDAVAA